MANHRHHDAVAGDMVGRVVVTRESIPVGQTHQPSRLARREESRTNILALDDKNRLATRTTSGRTQTARDVVKPDLSTLDLVAVRVEARASV